MKTFLVGGAVRDTLMGLEPKDRDFVVIGATAAEMLATGYRQQGKDFPVFIHPETLEEYALARVERKSGAGHRGFEFAVQDVTLEEDLSRRDLTINSMAMSEDGTVIDPYGGRDDLQDRMLRHTTEAFAEDPLRVLRIARFLARLGPGWKVAQATRELVTEMLDGGALDELPFERIWKELERGLMEPHPEEMLMFMVDMGMFEKAQVLRPLSHIDERAISNLRRAAAEGAGLPVRFALTFRPTPMSGESLEGLPSEVRDTAYAVEWARFQPVADFPQLTGPQRLEIIMRLDALRRPQRFFTTLAVLGYFSKHEASLWHDAIDRVRKVDGASIARDGGPDVAARIQAAREQALTD